MGLIASPVALNVANAAEPQPTVTGPVTGGDGQPRILSSSFDLTDVGYEGNEYFIAGTATAYTSATPLVSDGKWKVTPVTETPDAAFKTRIVVYRPIAAKDFNGTVWVGISAKALDATQLKALYPTHAAYVAAFTKSANQAVKKGFMLKPEAKNFIAAAKASSVGK